MHTTTIDLRRATALVLATGFMILGVASGARAQITLRIADFATPPMTGVVTGTGNDGSLARINFMREEPGNRGRFFVNDLNGPLYLLDKATKTFTKYLDFNGSGDRPGMFHKFTFENGFANGLICVQFDPAYERNGRFYTIHLEDPEQPGTLVPESRAVPGLKPGYTPTTPIPTPGEIDREAVLIEWTDTNTANTSFEGSARELMRVQLNTRIHPMGDVIFNPTAKEGDPDWRVLYVACGDGGSGEQKDERRQNPQRLDTLVGKILRIVPDLSDRTGDSTVSENGRYRIPNDNPFTSMAGARKEIWASGFRNVHRLTWDVDPGSPSTAYLIASVIGLYTRETVDIVRKGANYGYSEREGTEVLMPDNTKAPIPANDVIPVRVNGTDTRGTIAPTYPVIEYPHKPGGGDAVSGGFVYRGTRLPELRGKFVFGDISTGHVWYADFKEMVAADDGKPETLAAMHELPLVWDNPIAAKDPYPTVWPIVEAAYHARGGKDPDLPGRATVAGQGRVDMRFAVDAAGELYILSKSDGMIRAVVGASATPPRH